MNKKTSKRWRALPALLTVLIPFPSWCQTDVVHYDDHFNYSVIREYTELYQTGQHEIITAKLRNAGYVLKEHTPDYVLGKREYSGDYTFEKQVRFDENLSFPTTNKWEFKTIKYSDLVTEYKIDFRLYSTSSSMSFRSLSQDLENQGYGVAPVDNKWKCPPPDTCLQIGNIYETYCVTETDYTPELDLYPYFDPVSWGKSVTSNQTGKTYAIGNNESYYIWELTLGKSYSKDNRRSLKGFLYVRKLHHEIGDDPTEFMTSHDNQTVENKIKYRKEGNLYLLPIKIGDKVFDYIVDTGASDVVINASIEDYLKSIGILRDSDYLQPQLYKLADGSVKTYRRVKLESVRLGHHIVKNVIASIATGKDAPLLLGKSFLDKLLYWKINNETGHFEYKAR